MASSVAEGATKAEGMEMDEKRLDLKLKLYEEALDLVADVELQYVRPKDIYDLKIPGLMTEVEVLPYAQRLANEKYFKLAHDHLGVAWYVRSKEDAKRYRSFTPEQEGVYAIIDDAGQDGIWSKTVKTRFGLHDSIFAREIKFLLGKKYISEMKSVEHPTRKMYIKSTLTPSERATGGPWYTDGELDEELIGAVTQLLRGYTIRTTFYQTRIESSKRPKKVINNKNLTPEEVQAKRANGLGPPPTVKIKTEDSTSHSEHVSALTERKRKLASYLPMPSTYQNYPSLDVLTLFVDNSKILKEGTVLTSSDISQLLDIMIYDGNLTKVVSGDRVGYKAQRKALYEEEELGGVLSEVPCGRCPVFDLCEEGGPVGPSNCVYFSKWLEGGY